MGFERKLRTFAAAAGLAAASGETRPAEAMDVQPPTEQVDATDPRIARLPEQVREHLVTDIKTEAKRFVAYVKDPDIALSAAESGTNVSEGRMGLEVTKDDINRWMFNPQGFASRENLGEGVLWTQEELDRMQAGGVVSRTMSDTALRRMAPEHDLPFYLTDTMGLLAEMDQRLEHGQDAFNPLRNEKLSKEEKRAFVVSLTEAFGYTGPLLHFVHEEQKNSTNHETQKTSASREKVRHGDVVAAGLEQTRMYVEYLQSLVDQYPQTGEISYAEYREFVQRLATLSDYIPQANLVRGGYDEYSQLADLQAEILAADTATGGAIAIAVEDLHKSVEFMKARVSAADRAKFLHDHKDALDEQVTRELAKVTGEKPSQYQKDAIERTIAPELR